MCNRDLSELGRVCKREKKDSIVFFVFLATQENKLKKMLRNGSLATQSCTISQLSLCLNSLCHLWPVLIALLSTKSQRCCCYCCFLLLQAKLSLAAWPLLLAKCKYQQQPAGIKKLKSNGVSDNFSLCWLPLGPAGLCSKIARLLD